MTRDEYSAHWMEIVRAVLWAEGEVYPRWRERIKSATKSATSEPFVEVMDGYCKDITAEVLSYLDEGLAKVLKLED